MDKELQNHIWVVARTQLNQKLQALIEVYMYGLFMTLICPLALNQSVASTFAVDENSPHEKILAVDRSRVRSCLLSTPNLPVSFDDLFALEGKQNKAKRDRRDWSNVKCYIAAAVWVTLTCIVRPLMHIVCTNQWGLLLWLSLDDKLDVDGSSSLPVVHY